MRSHPVLIVSRDIPLQDAFVTGLRCARVPALAAEHEHTAVVRLAAATFRAIVVVVDRAGDWSACEKIAAAAVVGGVPVVVVTGWVAPDGRYRRRAFDGGCAAFMRKPASMRALLRTLERLDAGERSIEVID